VQPCGTDTVAACCELQEMSVRAVMERAAVRRDVAASLRGGSVMATTTVATARTRTASTAVNIPLITYVVSQLIN